MVSIRGISTRTIVVGVVSVALAAVVRAQAPAVPSEVRNFVQTEIESGGRMGIVIGLVNSDGVTYLNLGKASADGPFVDERSVFEIGSVTKTFTGALLADMAIRGEVTLDDPVEQFLPSAVTVPERNGTRITLAHLSTHTSALPRLPNNLRAADAQNPYAEYTVSQMYEFLSAHTLRRDIGSEFEYSNLAVGLLGHILALEAGRSYEDLVIERIADPLDLAETVITLTPDLEARLAYGHAGLEQVKNWDIPTFAGAGAIRSTAVDMVRYIAANMGLIETELAGAFTLAHEDRADAGGNSRIGLGWITTQRDSTAVTWHNGGTGGYRAFAGFNTEGLGAVVLSNSNVTVDPIGMRLLDPNTRLPEPRRAGDR